jgi:hypothetical protein
MLKELDTVVLTHDIPEQGLRKGDLGAVVLCHEGGEHYEVEFVTGDGKTVALLTLSKQDIRLRRDQEILHVREYA